MKETTIARHLRHVKVALRWGASVGMMPQASKIEMPKRAKGQSLMKGRPVTLEEFERMLAAVPKVRFHDPVLPWLYDNYRNIYEDWHAIQKAAGIKDGEHYVPNVSGGRSFDHFAGQERVWPALVCGGWRRRSGDRGGE